MTKNVVWITVLTLATVMAFWIGFMSQEGWEFVFFFCATVSSLSSLFLGLTTIIRAILEKDSNLLRLFWIIICCIFALVFVVPSWYMALGSIAFLPFSMPFSLQLSFYLLIIVLPFLLAAYGFYKLYGMSEKMRMNS